ncbi:MAG: J domain-containing protein [Spirochaetota bacterium]|nr:J domain-containing protein [Spirochaetota bacterium]
MDPLIERFERILRSFLNSGTADDSWKYASEDRDFQDAYAELDEFLRSGRNKDFGAWPHSGGNYSKGRTGTYDERFRMPPETLRHDYGRLKVPFGASFDEVRSSYRALMRRHHPDLHSADPSRHAEATRIAQELNLSYQRIKAWELAKRGG